MALQKDIAEKLGISTQAVNQLIKRWDISVQELSLDDAIKLFWKKISDSAAGRQDGLAEARAKTEVLKQEMLRFQIAEKSRSLVSTEDFRTAFIPMMKSFRTNVLSIPAQIVREAKALKGIDIEQEFIEDIVYEALEKCSETDVERLVDSVVDAGAGTETASPDDND